VGHDEDDKHPQPIQGQSAAAAHRAPPDAALGPVEGQTMKAKNKLVKLEQRVSYKLTQAQCNLSNSVLLNSGVYTTTIFRVNRVVTDNWQDFSPRVLRRDR
jgi:hypothetical protein